MKPPPWMDTSIKIEHWVPSRTPVVMGNDNCLHIFPIVILMHLHPKPERILYEYMLHSSRRVQQTPNSAQLWTKVFCPCEKTINSLMRFVPQLTLVSV